MEPEPAKRRRGRPPTHGLSGDPLYESIIKPILRRGLVVPEWRDDPRAFYDALLAEVGRRPSERHMLVPTTGDVFKPGNIKWYDRLLDAQAEATARLRECECAEVELATCQCSYAVARRQHALLTALYEDEPDLDSLGLSVRAVSNEEPSPNPALRALVDTLMAARSSRATSAFQTCDWCGDAVWCQLVARCVAER